MKNAATFLPSTEGGVPNLTGSIALLFSVHSKGRLDHAARVWSKSVQKTTSARGVIVGQVASFDAFGQVCVSKHVYTFMSWRRDLRLGDEGIGAQRLVPFGCYCLGPTCLLQHPACPSVLLWLPMTQILHGRLINVVCHGYD